MSLGRSNLGRYRRRSRQRSYAFDQAVEHHRAAGVRQGQGRRWCRAGSRRERDIAPKLAMHDALPLSLEIEELGLMNRKLRTEFEALELLLCDSLEEVRVPI